MTPTTPAQARELAAYAIPGNETLRCEARDALRSLADQLEAATTLSVTNIMLDVTPGDGSGHEVYAKSVADVVDVLTSLSDQLEAAQAELQRPESTEMTLTKTALQMVTQERDTYKLDAERYRDAAEALLSNQDHAISCGARAYQKGSPTDELWENLRAAIAKGAGA